MSSRLLCSVILVVGMAGVGSGQVLDKQAHLEAQTFWDNQDWSWYREHLPLFDCPDPELVTTYYYRWELLTKHLTYGSPNTGYTFTEFIDRPFWSGTYGAISCPAGHQLYEARWLRNSQIARDFARYWFHTPGAQPRRYSTWLADAVWALHEVHPDNNFTQTLLPDLVANYEGWEREHFVPEAGLFWQTGHDDGMEYNINSRQTQDLVRGAPGYRPTLNAYLWADALAIARIAELAEEEETARQFRDKAAGLKENLQQQLWDPERQFFLHRSMRDEQRDGYVVQANTLVYETGRYAGSPHGRELIGYVPWQFNLPDPGHEAAWKFLMDRDYFFAEFGPTTVERHDPLFHLSKTCCWWSGQSWPYATTQTLKAMANLLQNYEQEVVTRTDYLRLLQIYSRTHRKEGRPYLAEACHPDTGSFEGHDAYNHSEHYFHSGFADLIITGLVGLKPRNDDRLEIAPLAPPEWDYFALDDVVYRGRQVSILWDRTGSRYGYGAGLHVLVDGQAIASQDHLGPLQVDLPPARRAPADSSLRLVNYAVNNDGTYYPRLEATFTGEGTSANKVIDGNYWYHIHPPNRWTAKGSPHDQDRLVLDLGLARRIHTVKLYLLDDGSEIVAPAQYELDYWTGKTWQAVPQQQRTPEQPTGQRANTVEFPEIETSRLRVTLVHAKGHRSGLTELEAWGPATLPVPVAPPPEGNLAFNSGERPYPKARASHTSRYDKVEMVNDGRIVFDPTPHNRWTSYESPSSTDWLEIDFGEARRVGRVELYIYDDRGGVQAPQDYTVEYWTGQEWRPVARQRKDPPAPAGGTRNSVKFDAVKTEKIRVVFTHRGPSRSGLTEIEIWEQ